MSEAGGRGETVGSCHLPSLVRSCFLFSLGFVCSLDFVLVRYRVFLDTHDCCLPLHVPGRRASLKTGSS